MPQMPPYDSYGTPVNAYGAQNTQLHDVEEEAPQASGYKLIFWLLILAIAASLTVLGLWSAAKGLASLTQKLTDTSQEMQDAAGSVVGAVNETINLMTEFPTDASEPDYQAPESDVTQPSTGEEQAQEPEEAENTALEPGDVMQEPLDTTQETEQQPEPQEPTEVDHILVVNFDENADDWHKALTAHDALLWDTLTSGSSATTLPQEYAQILEGAGIPCTVVEGTFNNEQLSWCLVQIDDANYYIDIINDLLVPAPDSGQNGAVVHTYFGLSYEEMRLSGHILDESRFEPAAATSLAANFFVHNGIYLNAYDEVLLGQIIAKQAVSQDGDPYVFEVRFTNARAFEVARQVFLDTENLRQILSEATKLQPTEIAAHEVAAIYILTAIVTTKR
ncbi:MAG: hypothetical protein IKE43_08950 [Coriobacteriales bacterium]|nr:hypothetical protein [Coriobacteriales bacterium]